MSKKQINKLYLLTAVGYFLPAGSSWVALLALRGFSVLEIGLLESIFHIVSFCFELPSGVIADVFGRKKTLVLSQVMMLLSGGLMPPERGRLWLTTVLRKTGMKTLIIDFHQQR